MYRFFQTPRSFNVKAVKKKEQLHSSQKVSEEILIYLLGCRSASYVSLLFYDFPVILKGKLKKPQKTVLMIEPQAVK